jgi:hypothetical protein
MKADTPRLGLRHPAQGRLTLTDAAGTVHDGVLPVRLFPLTDPSHWVALIGGDGGELACIENPDELAEEERQVLLEALAYRDFVPVIELIETIRRAAHGYDWQVVTDRGRVRFTVENDESIQPLGGGGIVIVDRNNTRYLIPRCSAMDARSRQKLERYY